jgi:small subunit ribosomal protein S15
MARMYSRIKGKAGSKKPLNPKKPLWVRYDIKEIEMLIAKLAKEENTSSSKIGTILRDSYGIPDVTQITGKRIQQILKSKNLLKEIPEDLRDLIKRALSIRKHLELNKHDYTAKRGLQLTESKINRLVYYYKTKKKLPKEWKYDPVTAKMFVE